MKNAAAIVITDFGDYFPSDEELERFKKEYGDKPVRVSGWFGRYTVPMWDVKLTKHASAIMREQWERGE